MENLNQVVYRWLKKFSQWPRWLQVLVILGVMGALALGMNLGGNPQADTADPFSNPTALAFGVFLKLGGVVALIYCASLLFRRWQGGAWKPPARQMNIVETVHLSPRRALHLVKVGDQVLLIGATDQSVSLISEVKTDPSLEPQVVQPKPATSPSFADVLSFASRPINTSSNR